MGPRDAALEPQFAAHHVGQFEVHLVVADRPPRVVVQHLHAPFVWLSGVVACQAHLGARRPDSPSLGGSGGPSGFGAAGTAERQQQQDGEAPAEVKGHHDCTEEAWGRRGRDWKAEFSSPSFFLSFNADVCGRSPTQARGGQANPTQEEPSWNQPARSGLRRHEGALNYTEASF